MSVTEKERDLSDDISKSRLVLWGPGEFLRVVSDQETAAVVWSTTLSLSSLVAVVRERAVLSTEDAALLQTIDRAGKSVLHQVDTVDVDRQIRAAGDSLESAQIPFQDFWLSWGRHSRSDERSNKYSEVAITYDRTELISVDPTYLKDTGTPSVRDLAPKKLRQFEHLDII